MKHLWKLLMPAMVLALLAAMPAAMADPDATALTLNETATAEIASEGGMAYFSFTPTVSDEYMFYSSSNSDTYGYLYDADMNELLENDDNGLNNNFSLVWQLEANQTYYLGARYLSGETTGSFSVGVRLSSQFYAAPLGDSSVHVDPGSDVQMAVSASSRNGDVQYQWYAPMDNGDGTYRYDIIQGATDSAWTVQNVTEPASYYCLAADGYGSATEIWFYIAFENGFSAGADGECNLCVDYGGSATMTVAASCENGELHYQWYGRLYEEGGSYGYQPVPDATGLSYTSEALYHYTDFYCAVWDDYGNNASVWFNIGIDNQFSAEPDGDSSFEIAPGESVTMKVTASCQTGGLHCQWYGRAYNEDGSYSYQPVPDATGLSYTSEALYHYTDFYCAVWDDYGNNTSAWFNIGIDNQFTADADGSNTFEVALGGSATMKVTASCQTGELHYQWRKQVYEEATHSTFYQPIADATGASYTAENIEATGYYCCTVEDDYDNETTVYFSVRIDNNLSAYSVGNSTLYVPINDDVEMAVIASCRTGSLQYQWYRHEDDGYISRDEVIAGANTDTYTAENITGRSVFYCQVMDDFGNVNTVWYYLFIDNLFHADCEGQSSIYLLSGESATLRLDAGCDQGDLHIQWYGRVYDEDGDDYDFDIIEGATGLEYTTPPITRNTSFHCSVSDDYDNSEDVWYYLYIDNGLSIAEDDVWLTVASGETVRLEVAALCDDDSLTYSWYESGESIPDVTGPVCEVGPMERYTEYCCGVSDGFGNSREVYFYVSIENGFTAAPTGSAEITRDLSQPQTLAVTASCDSGDLSYKWSADYYDFSEEAWVEGSFDEAGPSMTLPDNAARGTFTCTVIDGYGNEEYVDFKVLPPARFTARSDGPMVQTVSAGQQAVLKVSVTGMDEGLSYRWYENDRPIADATAASYTTPELFRDTEYYCMVESIYGQGEDIHFTCAVDVPTLTLDTDIPVTFNGGCRFYTFTPKATDTYTLESSGNRDTYVTLFDADFEELDSDDDSGPSYNFSLVRELTAGTTYYFRVRDYNSYSVNFSMRLTRGGTAHTDRYNSFYMLPGQTVQTRFHSCDLVSLTSSNPAVLSTSGDRVTAVAAGTALLTAEYVCGECMEYNVIVGGSVSFNLPADLREIHAGAFAGDGHLEYLVLDENVTSVGSDAFNGTGLKLLVVTGRQTRLRGGSLRGTTEERLTVICPRGSAADNYARGQRCVVLYLVD